MILASFIIKNNIAYRYSEFCYCIFHNAQRRSLLFALILLCVRQLSPLFALLPAADTKMNASIKSSLNDYVFDSSDSIFHYQTALFFIVFSMNCICLVYLIKHILAGRRTTQSVELSRPHSFILDKILSVFEYAITLPSLIISTRSFESSSPLAAINISLTILNSNPNAFYHTVNNLFFLSLDSGLLLSAGDFDFAFNNTSDRLQRRKDDTQLITFIFEMLSTLFQTPSFLPIACLLFASLYKFIRLLKLHGSYFDFHMHRISMAFTILNGAQAILLLVVDTSDINSFEYLGFLCAIPFSFAVAFRIANSQKCFDSTEQSIIQIDNYLRFLIANAELAYSSVATADSAASQILIQQALSQSQWKRVHSIYKIHVYDYWCIQDILAYDVHFFQSLNEAEQAALCNLGKKQRVHEYVRGVYTRLAKTQPNSFICLSYFEFLGEILNNIPLTLLEANKHRTKDYILQSQVNIIIKKYTLAMTPNQQMSNISKVMECDERQSKIQYQMNDYLTLKKEVLVFLSMATIDLNSLELSLIALTTSQIKLKSQLNHLSQISSTSAYLRSISSYLREIFPCSAILANAIQLQKQMQLKAAAATDATASPPSSTTCVAFLSIAAQEEGKILRVSQNFSQSFDLHSNLDCIGTNIDFLLPEPLVYSHRQMIQKELQGSVAPSFMKQSIVIGCDRQGWAIPLSLKLSFGTLNQLGIYCEIETLPPEKHHSYILADISQETPSVICISHSFYRRFYKRSYRHFSDIQLSKSLPIILTNWNALLTSEAFRNCEGVRIHRQQRHTTISLTSILVMPKIAITASHTDNGSGSFTTEFPSVKSSSERVFSAHLKLKLVQSMSVVTIELSSIQELVTSTQLTESFQQFFKVASILNISSEALQPLLLMRQSLMKQSSLQIFHEERNHHSVSMVIPMFDFPPKTNTNSNSSFEMNNSMNYEEEFTAALPTTVRQQSTSIAGEISTPRKSIITSKASLMEYKSPRLTQRSLALENISSLRTENHLMTTENNLQMFAKQPPTIMAAGKQNAQMASTNTRVSTLISTNNRLRSTYRLSTHLFSTNIIPAISQTDFPSQSETDEEHRPAIDSATYQQQPDFMDKNNGTSDRNNDIACSIPPPIFKKAFSKFVDPKNKLRKIMVVNYLCALFLTAMITYDSIAFASSIDELYLEEKNLKHVDYLSEINAMVSISNTNIQFERLLDHNFFSYTASQTTVIRKIIESNLQESLQTMKDQVASFYDPSKRDLIFFETILQRNTEFFIYYNDDVKATFNSSLVYYSVAETAFLAMFNNHLDKQQIFQGNLEINFQPLNTLLFYLLTDIDLLFKSTALSVEDNLNTRLLIFSVLNALFAAIVLITIQVISYKRNQIIQVFAHIDPKTLVFLQEKVDDLQSRLNKFTQVQSLSRVEFKKQRQSTASDFYRQINLRRSVKDQDSLAQMQKKTKRSSEVIALRTSNKKYILIILVLYLCLQIQPIANYVASSNFQKAFSRRYKIACKHVFLVCFIVSLTYDSSSGYDEHAIDLQRDELVHIQSIDFKHVS